MIKKYFENLIVEKIEIAIENAISNNFDSVIMDDGFQDNTIKKNMNIVCFNDSQLIVMVLLYLQAFKKVHNL